MQILCRALNLFDLLPFEPSCNVYGHTSLSLSLSLSLSRVRVYLFTIKIMENVLLRRSPKNLTQSFLVGRKSSCQVFFCSSSVYRYSNYCRVTTYLPTYLLTYLDMADCINTVQQQITIRYRHRTLTRQAYSSSVFSGAFPAYLSLFRLSTNVLNLNC